MTVSVPIAAAAIATWGTVRLTALILSHVRAQRAAARKAAQGKP